MLNEVSVMALCLYLRNPLDPTHNRRCTSGTAALLRPALLHLIITLQVGLFLASFGQAAEECTGADEAYFTAIQWFDALFHTFTP